MFNNMDDFQKYMKWLAAVLIFMLLFTFIFFWGIGQMVLWGLDNRCEITTIDTNTDWYVSHPVVDEEFTLFLAEQERLQREAWCEAFPDKCNDYD